MASFSLISSFRLFTCAILTLFGIGYVYQHQFIHIPAQPKPYTHSLNKSFHVPALYAATRLEPPIEIHTLPSIRPNRTTSVGKNESYPQMKSQLFIPLFLKLHKVGSGAVADLFRHHCRQTSRKLGFGEGENYHWRPRPGVFCGKTPHEHASMTVYNKGGVEAFSRCTQPPDYDNPSSSQLPLPPRHRVQLFTVLRDPIDKFLSGIFFWKSKDIDAIPELKSKLVEGNASAFTVADMELLTRVLFKRNQEKFINAGPLFPYNYVFSRLPTDARRDNPTRTDTEVACRRLREDFIVGRTELMNSFLVLLALENGWPLEEVCGEKSHSNSKRPKRKDFSPEVQAYLTDLFESEERIAQCAMDAHIEQTKRHSNFTSALKLFTSDSFQEKCKDINKAKQKHISSLTRKERMTFYRSGDCSFE